MKKLRLDLDALNVESFESDRIAPPRGTVHGRLRYTDPRACPVTGNWYCSVGDTCSEPRYSCGLTDCFTDCGATDCPGLRSRPNAFADNAGCRARSRHPAVVPADAFTWSSGTRERPHRGCMRSLAVGRTDDDFMSSSAIYPHLSAVSRPLPSTEQHMNKMKLDLDSLFVESFDTSSGPAGRGTVRGLDSWLEPETIAASCDCPPPPTGPTACGQATCGASCTCPYTDVTCAGSTCWQTCPDSCNACGWQIPQG